MNKLKGYLIYNKQQTNEVATFLEKADGCEYITFPAMEAELVSLLGAENVFDVIKAQEILKQNITNTEIAQTLSHIQCWKAVLENQAIDENDFVIIAEPTITLSPNYYSALTQHIEKLLQGSHYQMAMLQRSDNDDHWNNQIYSGEGEISSILFNLPRAYNSAQCAMYLIRKSFIRTALSSLNTQKPYWLSHYFAEFCDIGKIVQTNLLLAVSHNVELLKFKKPIAPKFSIIIPVYNVEKYLIEAVESILAQDYTDYEIILVNDSSTDASSQICFDYAKKYPHITMISHPNRGLSGSRNVAMKIARGDYFIFLDSDDFWKGTHILSDMAAILEKNPVDFILHYVTSVFPDETIEHIMPSDKLTNNLENDFYELVDNKTFQGYAWLKTVSRKLVEKHQMQFPEGRYFEDVYWSYFLVKNAKSYAMYHSAHYMYRRNREGAITSFMAPEKVADMIHLFTQCNNDLRETIKRDNVYRGLRLFIDNFGDYITLCHSKLFPDQQESIKGAFNAFTKDLEFSKSNK